MPVPLRSGLTGPGLEQCLVRKTEELQVHVLRVFVDIFDHDGDPLAQRDVIGGAERGIISGRKIHESNYVEASDAGHVLLFVALARVEMRLSLYFPQKRLA